MDSILTSIKKLLGIDSEYTHFDQDLIIHINTAFGILTQLGAGPSSGFSISGNSEEWEDFLDESPLLNLSKTYVQMKVRLFFDPPDKGPLIESINKVLSELEWRIEVEASRGGEEETLE